VTQGTAQDTLTAPFNDLEAVQRLVENNLRNIAAIIIEPVAGNMGCVLPQKDFLAGLRILCDKNGIVLIFDEVMTGFRLSLGGAQEVLKVKPDLTTLGKIIGGGMPVGAYGGKKEIMVKVSTVGPEDHAGTVLGYPIAMTSGHAMFNYLKESPATDIQLDTISNKYVQSIREKLSKLALHYT